MAGPGQPLPGVPESPGRWTAAGQCTPPNPGPGDIVGAPTVIYTAGSCPTPWVRATLWGGFTGDLAIQTMAATEAAAAVVGMSGMAQACFPSTNNLILLSRNTGPTARMVNAYFEGVNTPPGWRNATWGEYVQVNAGQTESFAVAPQGALDVRVTVQGGPVTVRVTDPNGLVTLEVNLPVGTVLALGPQVPGMEIGVGAPPGPNVNVSVQQFVSWPAG